MTIHELPRNEHVPSQSPDLTRVAHHRLCRAIGRRSAPSFALGADTVTIGGLTYVNKGLVGVGRLPADLRDKFGETFGSGSGMAVDAKSWMRTPAGYQGTFYMLPDRGYNIGGTTDYRARINKLTITFTPLVDPAAVPSRGATEERHGDAGRQHPADRSGGEVADRARSGG